MQLCLFEEEAEEVFEPSIFAPAEIGQITSNTRYGNREYSWMFQVDILHIESGTAYCRITKEWKRHAPHCDRSIIYEVPLFLLGEISYAI